MNNFDFIHLQYCVLDISQNVLAITVNRDCTMSLIWSRKILVDELWKSVKYQTCKNQHTFTRLPHAWSELEIYYSMPWIPTLIYTYVFNVLPLTLTPINYKLIVHGVMTYLCLLLITAQGSSVQCLMDCSINVKKIATQSRKRLGTRINTS